MARLRDLFGDDLLVGNAHGMAPTPRAEAMAGRLHELLEELGGLVAEGAAFEPARAERSFSIAASDLEHALLLPVLLPRLAAEAPNVRIAAVTPAPDTLAARMTEGRVDMAITVPERTPEGFPGIALVDDTFRAIWREGHPRLGGEIDLDAFCGEGQIFVSTSGGDFRGIVDESLARIGRARRVAASLPSFLSVPPVVRGSDLVGVVPARLAERDGAGLRSAPLPVETRGFSLFLAWHPRLRSDPGHRWLRRLVSDLSKR